MGERKAYKRWTAEDRDLLRRLYPDHHLPSLAARLGVTVKAMSGMARSLGLRRAVNVKHPWTEEDTAYLRRHYATRTADEIGRATGHSPLTVYNHARLLGLRKDKAWLQEHGRRNSQHPNCVAHRWSADHHPQNKGRRQTEFMSREGIERSARTRFKKGHQPHNAHPVGYESVRDNGYTYIKADGMGRMMLKHRWLWEQAHGAIPEGYTVMFRDGDRTHCVLENLELVSRQDACRRRTMNETEQERRERVRRVTESRNETIRRDKIRLHFGLEPRSRLVKRW